MKKNHHIIWPGLVLAVWGSLAQAGTIYECNGIYTDKPSANCRNQGSASLPAIGSYSSARVEPMRNVAQTSEAAPTQAAPRNNVRRAVNQAAPSKQNVRAVAYTQPSLPTVAPAAAAPTKLSGNSGRRAILQQELENERRALAMAQAALIRARAVKNGVSVDQQQVGGLQNNIFDRQQNIQALQRELSRM